MAKINTTCVCPPIPTTAFDWKAWYGDMDENTDCGWGETEQDAIADLKANHDEPEHDRANDCFYRGRWFRDGDDARQAEQDGEFDGGWEE